MIEEIYNYIIEQFQTNQFFSGAAVATFLGSLLYSLKSLPKNIWTRINRLIKYKVYVYEKTELYEAIESYLYNHHKSRYRNVEGFLSKKRKSKEYTVSPFSRTEYDTSIKEEIIYHHNEDFFYIKNNGFYIRIEKDKEKLDNASDPDRVYLKNFVLSTFFFKRKLNSFIQKAYDEYYEKKLLDKTLNVYTNENDYWEKRKEFKRPIDNIFLKKGEKELILKDLDKFKEKKEIYNKFSLPYKRGYLFYGKSGMGKTSIASAIATELNNNLCVLNLQSVKEDSDLQTLFADIKPNSILLIEDIDASFDGRKPLGGITFSALLNVLDGLFTPDDLITIITTNHKDKLDEALIRNGRIDFELEFTPPDKYQIEQVINKFYQKENYNIGFNPICNDNMAKIIDLAINVSFDKFIEYINKYK